MLKGWDGPKFDETVEAHFRLGLNVRHADQQLRGTLMLPHGTGKRAARRRLRRGREGEGGARPPAPTSSARPISRSGSRRASTDFDVAIATPDQMGNVGKLGRILGPRGLMPNPKTGTVTFDVAKAVQESKAGKLEYRTDRGANVHLPIGKKSFDEKQLLENYATRDRGDRPREAVGGEGPLHPLDHADDDDGPRRPRRHDPHPRDRGGARGGSSYSYGLTTVARQRQLAAGRRQKPSRGESSGQASGLSRWARLGGPSSFRGQQMLKSETRRRIVAELTERLKDDADAVRRRLPRPLGHRDRRPAHEADRARRALHGREEHADEARGRGGRRRRAARHARGPDRDRLHRGRRRHGRRREGARRLGADDARSSRSAAASSTARRSARRTSRTWRRCRRSTCSAARCSARSPRR